MATKVRPSLDQILEFAREFVRTEVHPLEAYLLRQQNDEFLPKVREKREKVKPEYAGIEPRAHERDTLLSRWYRHERPSRICDGADEVHKCLVARETPKKYGVKISG